MKGLTLTVNDDGTYSITEFDGELEQLQAAVGGWIEPIPTSENVTIYVNEEGKIYGLPVNRLAMDVWIRWDEWRCMIAGDWIAGNAVVVGGVDDDGETMDLSDLDRRWVKRVAREAVTA